MRWPKLLLTLLLAGPLSAQDQDEPAPHPGHEGPGSSQDADGSLGRYDAAREASGTTRQPESSPMEGFHFEGGSRSSVSASPHLHSMSRKGFPFSVTTKSTSRPSTSRK